MGALNRNPIWYAAITLLFAAQAALILTHVAWPDEWQALLIGLQSPSWPALVENLRYEGHPPLWYLLLVAVAGAGVPTGGVLGVTQLLLATATKALILVRAPFSRGDRLLLCLSYLILFEYGVVARGYGLGVLLLFGFAAAKGRVLPWLAVALLPLVDFHFGLLSLLGLAALWRDRRWWWPGAALWLAASLLAAWSVLPPADVVPAYEAGPDGLGNFIAAVSRLGNLLVQLPIVEDDYWWEATLPHGTAGPAAALFLVLGYLQTRGRIDPMIAFWGFTAACLAFASFVYPMGTRTAGLIAILLILLAWRDAERGEQPTRWFRWWLVASAASGLVAAGVATVTPFDRVKEVARHIKTNGQADRVIAVYPFMHGTSLAGTLRRDVLSLSKGCLQSFVRWDHRDAIENPIGFAAAAANTARWYGPYLLLVRGDLERDLGPAFDPQLFRLDRRFDTGMDGRRYFLYRVGEGLASTGNTPPVCAPARLPIPG